MKLLVPSYKWDEIFYHKRLNAYFVKTKPMLSDERIHCKDAGCPRKINQGDYYFAPVFLYDWCIEWIPSGLSGDANLRKLNDKELRTFRSLYG